MLNEENYISTNQSDPGGTDPDADEMSDSEGSDDDRNHKHRRRESSPRPPESNDRNAPALQEESSPLQPNKKRVRPFETKFERRRFRPNQFHSRGRGRGRNNTNTNQPVQWGSQPDPRFNMVPVPVPPLEMHDLALVASLGGPGPYGFIPGMSNGMMMDPVPVPMHAMMEHHHIGMPRQRCADFEERGFCLRGDMCPMEHGINRIVVEDVQSLSQLKLLTPGPKPVMPIKDPLRPNGADADVYDPDQPLWNNNNNNNGSKPDPLTTGTEDPLYQPDPSSSVWGRISAKTNKSKSNSNPSLHEGEAGMSRQRATRTLYICGVPQKDNRAESLFSHFKKFGTVIDIYVPANSEKAFVQFAKREEAESALVAPDAVMGNRFIKVLWANRDRIADEISTGTGTYHPKPLQSSQLTPASDKRKGNSMNTPNSGVKAAGTNTSTGTSPVNGLKAQGQGQMEGPVLKKTESMDLLEELRKKQEDLARKRIEFRKQLAKLEKQTSFGKKVEQTGDSPKPSAIKVRKVVQQEATQMATQKKSDTKDLVTPSSFRPNRFKIDNRPVQFQILSLPHDISDTSILKEHFSQFGELASINLEEKEKDKEVVVTYTKHESAERAFVSATSFKGHNLSFMWVKNAHTSNTVTTPNSKTPPVQAELERSESKSPPVKDELERPGSKSPPAQAELEVSGSKTPPVQPELEKPRAKTPPVQAELETFGSPVNGAVANTDGGQCDDADVANSGIVHD